MVFNMSLLESTLRDIYNFIEFYSLNPWKDMSQLEEKVVKLCNMEISSEEDIRIFHHELPKIISNVNRLEQIVQNNMKRTPGYSAYKKAIDANT